MKKTFSRAFSLLLVLALLVSVIPSALAVDGDSSSNVVGVGESLSLTATAPDDQVANLKWSSSNVQVATVTGDGTNTGTVSGVSAGTATITAKVEAADTGDTTGTNDDTSGETPAAPYEVSFTVNVISYATSIDVQPSTLELKVDETATLTATINSGSNDTITWADDGNKIASVDPKTGVVTALKEGEATITAYSGKDRSVHDTCTVTVSKKDITPTAPTVETLYVGGKTNPIKLGGLPTSSSDYTVTWAVKSGDDKISVTSDGVVTALKAGSATLKAAVALTDSGKDKFNLTKTEVEVPVIVKDSGIIANDISVKAGETDTITLSLSDKSATNIKYTVTSTSGSPSYTLSGDGNKIITITTTTKTAEDVYTFNVKATYDTAGKTGVEVTGSVKAYVYRTDNEIYMTVTGSFASGSLTNVTSISKNGGKEYTNVTLNGMLQQTGAVDVEVDSGYGDKIGDFKEHTWNVLNSVTFAVNSTGERYYGYELTTSTGLTVSKGYINIKAVNTTADIQYSTTYNKSITFDSSKFTTFWNNNKKANDFTSSLSYVTFDVAGGVYPQYGKLTYNDKSFTYNTKFYTSSKETYYLDKVTYVPDSTLKSSYYVTIPFTAYGTKTSEKMSGTVKIALNESDFLISSNGVQFGLGTTSVVDLMKEAYKAATGAELAYATFPNLSVSTGKLYYNYSTVLNNTPVVSSYEFYVTPTTSQKDLDKVVLVPRAGLTGKISFSFYGYDSKGDNKKLCTIELEVQELTKSEEFTDVGTSYSWAAASVEFLAAQGVAQGSNGKYRPSAYITRGDFMLMLYRAFLEDEHKNDSITSNFSDVTKGTTTYSKETYQAVGVAKKLGIAQGTNGKFNPKSYITRQEAMTLIYRTLDEVNYDLEYTVSTSTSSFKDYSSVASYAKTAISDLIGHGIVIGNNNKINPTSNITRAEMAVILHRVLTY